MPLPPPQPQVTAADEQPQTATFAELDARTLYQLLRLRSDVFVVEQQCPYPDLDGRDVEPETRHLWFTEADRPVAYLRILAEPDGSAKISRVVVAAQARGTGYGHRLLAGALAIVGERPCVLDAQVHAIDFYRRYGFHAAGPQFIEDGIAHLPMRREPSTPPAVPAGWTGSGQRGDQFGHRAAMAGVEGHLLTHVPAGRGGA